MIGSKNADDPLLLITGNNFQRSVKEVVLEINNRQ